MRSALLLVAVLVLLSLPVGCAKQTSLKDRVWQTRGADVKACIDSIVKNDLKIPLGDPTFQAAVARLQTPDFTLLLSVTCDAIFFNVVGTALDGNRMIVYSPKVPISKLAQEDCCPFKQVQSEMTLEPSIYWVEY